MTTKSRYCVGIDLGTTNTAVAFVDLLTAHGEVRPYSGLELTQSFDIDQVVAVGVRQKQRTLPSAILLDANSNDGIVTGRYALEQQVDQPERVVSSAKSWLANRSINRDAEILPWGSDQRHVKQLLSPVTAARHILESVRDAWNCTMALHEPSYQLQAQRVVVTVPASFDEVAQQLTLRAARDAGFLHIQLIEEPQAAFYRWLEVHGQKPAELQNISRDELILVCDVGGGTTDLSLFSIADTKSGLPEIARIAVSNHILLGGDNVDAAVAEHFREMYVRDTGREMTHSQLVALRAHARSVKERVLGADLSGSEKISIAIPGGGSSLFSQSSTLSASVGVLRHLIVEGFFPKCAEDEVVIEGKGALRDAGLPYARDPRITVHLAEFLSGKKVGAVLFNGGSLASDTIRERVLDCIADWQDGARPIELQNTELDLAVACGAAWYGFIVSSAQRRLIDAGYPRSLYVELFRKRRTDQKRLLCVIPKGFSSTEPIAVPTDGLAVLLNRPVRFQVWSSHRESDQLGTIVDLDESKFAALAPIATKLSLSSKARGGEAVPIRLLARISETGLFGLSCEAESTAAVEGTSADIVEISPQRWDFEFNVREESGGNVEPSAVRADPRIVQACTERIDLLFGKRRDVETTISDKMDGSPRSLFKDLETIVRAERSKWEVTLLRALWPALQRGITRRGRSVEHEVAWLSLAGFLLRPGFGAPLDETRINEAWRVFEARLSFPKEPSARAAQCIFWRRVAGGLDAIRQEQIFELSMTEFASRPKHLPEVLRLACSLERLSIQRKQELFDLLLRLLRQNQAISTVQSVLWGIERLVARVPLYGEIDTIVPGTTADRWATTLLEESKVGAIDAHRVSFTRCLASLGRKTEDPRREITSDTRASILRRLGALGAASELMQMVNNVAEIEPATLVRLFGDELPAGLLLTK